MPMKNGNANMFCEEDDKTLYLRDVTRLVGTRGIGKRRELSGEVINDPHKLKKFLEQKLAMQSTNVTKSFRNLDNDYSGTLDRDEFRNFLENINIHTTESCHNQVFEMLDADHSGVVEFREFMKAFGPAISGESVGGGLAFGKSRDAMLIQQNAERIKKRFEASSYNADAAIILLKSKLANQSTSVRKLYQTANFNFQQEGEVEGGLSKEEFKSLFDKFNIPITDAELSKMYKTLDPDGSGLISYVEFQREFGSAIAGDVGGDSIRWGYSSVPLKHSKAAEYSVVAEEASQFWKRKGVSGGGKIHADGTSPTPANGAPEAEAVAGAANRSSYANRLPLAFGPGARGGNRPSSAPAQRKTLLQQHKASLRKQQAKKEGEPSPGSGTKLTKTEALLKWRQERSAQKEAEFAERFAPKCPPPLRPTSASHRPATNNGSRGGGRLPSPAFSDSTSTPLNGQAPKSFAEPRGSQPPPPSPATPSRAAVAVPPLVLSPVRPKSAARSTGFAPESSGAPPGEASPGSRDGMVLQLRPRTGDQGARRRDALKSRLRKQFGPGSGGRIGGFGFAQ